MTRWLYYPTSMFFICLFLSATYLTLNGAWYQLYKLDRDRDQVLEEIRKTEIALASLAKDLTQAKDPRFIERQAFDKMDMASEHDLIFVFSDEETH